MSRMSKEAGTTLLAMFRGAQARFRLENPGAIHLLQEEIMSRTAGDDDADPVAPTPPVPDENAPIDPAFKAKMDRAAAAEPDTLEFHLAMHDLDTHYQGTHYVDIAKACYEANRTYAASLGDTSFGPWEEAPDWQKLTNIKGVLYKLNNPDVTPEMSHESWLKEKAETGWVYGEVKDAEKKTHPCIKPYNELPKEQQFKDALFLSIVNALRAPIAQP